MERIALALLILLNAACVAESSGGTAPIAQEGHAGGTVSAQRVMSGEGFSFLPPQGRDWSEQLQGNQVRYAKVTDMSQVSFHAGAVDGRLESTFASTEELLASVRTHKDRWGTDGRYTVTNAAFVIDAQAPNCVVYDTSARDHGAPNKGVHDYLMMDSRGRFCVHPDAPASFVDIFYSVRYAPSFDPAPLVTEGEAFVGSLRFERR